MKEKRIFASLLGMEEQTKEVRLQWAKDNGMVWSVDWFITNINTMIDINRYQFDSYEAELNDSMVCVNIVELASELADNQTKIEMFGNDSLFLDEEEEALMYEFDMDGNSTYTEVAQDIFNVLYDYYYSVISKWK